MKKSLVAIAALTLVGAASAQVTLTGNVSFSLQKDLSGTRGIAMSDNSIFLGDTEDLGGGTKLVMKTGFDAGGRSVTAAGANGANFGAEDSSLTVMGSFGSFKLASFESDGFAANVEGLSGASLSTGMFDTGGVGTGKVMRNGAFYNTPSMSGFTAGLAYVTKAGQYLPSDTYDAGTKVVPSVKYSNGPLTVYFEDAFFNQSYFNNANDPATNPGAYAMYDFGAAKVGLSWSKPTYTSATTGFGVSVPLGALTVGLSYFTYGGPVAGNVGNANWTEAAVAYSLSKRTSLKASFGTVNDAFNTYAGNVGTYASTTQSRVGLFHSF